MSDPAAFPKIKPKPHLRLKEDLPGQIYTLDGFLSKDEQRDVLKWAQTADMQAPTKPGKGEAERTARRAALDSPDIASALLSALSPHLPNLSPAYAPRAPTLPLLSPNIRIYHYPPGTFFRGHYDSPQMDLRSRRLSCWTVLVYLSEGVKGGGTTFWADGEGRDGRGKGKGKVKVKEGKAGKIGKEGKSEKAEKRTGQASPGCLTFEPKAGRVLLHWHGVARGGCMLHEGDEVVSGDKWVLRTDVLA